MSKKVVIIGTGSIGMKHAETLRSMGVEVFLLPSRKMRIEQLKEVGWKVLAKLEEALAEGVKFCVVATNTEKHVDDVLAASLLGLRVLVEKPLGISIIDIEKLENHLSNQQLSDLRVACVMRFHGVIELVASEIKKLGKIHSVEVVCRSYLPEWRPNQNYKDSYSASVEQGGVLRDLVHELDYCGMMFGFPKSKSLVSVVSRGGVIDIDSTCNALLGWKTDDSNIVNIQLDYLTRKARRQICVYGELGEIKGDLVCNKVSICPLGEEPKSVQLDGLGNAYQRMLLSFLEQDGRGCCYLEAKQAMSMIDACETSRVE